MAFASASRRVVQKYTVPMTNSGTGAVAITPEWTLPFAPDVTPGDIASTNGIIYEGTGAATSPEAYSPQPLSDVQVLGHGLRASADLRVKVDAAGGGETDSTAGFVLFLPSLGVSPTVAAVPLRLFITADVGGGGTTNFRFRWGSTTVTTTPAFTVNAWHRVGWEILPEENIVRSYINLTSAAQGEAANAALAVQSEITMTGANEPLASTPYYVGCQFSNPSSVSPSGPVPDFTGITDIIVELFERTFVPPTFPTGAMFQFQLTDPYATYKSTTFLHQLFNNARLL